jgi:hypothetical protein
MDLPGLGGARRRRYGGAAPPLLHAALPLVHALGRLRGLAPALRLLALGLGLGLGLGIGC